MAAIRLDAHQHFWRYNDADYTWMDDSQQILKQDYLPAHLQPHLIENGFHGSVLVQARQTSDEMDFLVALGKESEFIRGIVGWADLTAPNVLATLSNYQGQVNGFRHQLEDEDPAFMLENDFKRGIRLLQDFGYTYDLLIRPEHLEAARMLVDEFPDQPFVVDHLAKPVFTPDGFNGWEPAFRELARRENVFCKLSGMVTEPREETWDDDEVLIDDFLPFLDCALEAFGAERLMFGSDWPVCTLMATYDEVYDIVGAFLHRLSTAEQEAIMGETAARFYNITLD